MILWAKDRTLLCPQCMLETIELDLRPGGMRQEGRRAGGGKEIIYFVLQNDGENVVQCYCTSSLCNSASFHSAPLLLLLLPLFL